MHGTGFCCSVLSAELDVKGSKLLGASVDDQPQVGVVRVDRQSTNEQQSLSSATNSCSRCIESSPFT